MTIRRANERDIPGLLRLLSQVLELHAALRPDCFVPGTTKYSAQELTAILNDETTPVWTAVDENGAVLGYVFCILRRPPANKNLVPFTSLYIDDLCVDEAQRGKGLGAALFRRAVSEARRMGCYEVTLNVWNGNDAAQRFYEKMGMRPKSTQLEFLL